MSWTKKQQAMREEDYYPAGAYDDPRAPYNEIEIPEKVFDVSISQTLYKNDISVETNDYIPEYCEESGHTYADTSETDWRKVYDNDRHYTPLELIATLKQMCEEMLEFGVMRTDFRIEWLVRECSGWEEDETDIGLA